MDESKRIKGFLKLFIILVLAFLIGFLIAWFSRGSAKNETLKKENAHPGFSQKLVDDMVNAVNPKNIKKYLRTYAGRPHLAGTPQDKINAEKLYKFWKELGFMTHIIPYKVLLSFPIGDPEKTNMVEFQKANGLWRSAKYEKKLGSFPYNYSEMVQPFNGFSGNGDVSGTLIYVNYGREQDFQYLKDNFNMNFEGKIVIAKYGKIFRGDKALAAQRWKAKGIILFTAPLDYAPESVGDTFPKGILMPSSGVQRGSLLIGGDQLTPDFPATNDTFSYRISMDEIKNSINIPVIPISYGDARELLDHETADDKPVKELPSDWKHGLKLKYADTSLYYIYQDQSKIQRTVNVKVNLLKELRTTYNVHATIMGTTEMDRYVIVGNHRDAWTHGSLDPSSGTASMLEISRVIAKAHKEKKWVPRRNIIFCSWAAEEQGLIGSTEWVEQYSHILSNRVVAYINTDISVQGTDTFRGRVSSSLIENVMLEATKNVGNPNKAEYKEGRKSVFDTWKKFYPNKKNPEKPHLIPLGSGSDFEPFVTKLGVTSADIRYSFDPNLPLSSYPLYHTMYETVELIEKFYDPDYAYHASVSKIMLYMTLRLSESAVLPFEPILFSEQLETNIKSFYEKALKVSNVKMPTDVKDALDDLKKAAGNLKSRAVIFDSSVRKVDKNRHLSVRSINDRLMEIERHFIHPQGLPNRPRMRNLLLSPSVHNSYSATMLPGLYDTLYEVNHKQTNSWKEVHKQISLLSVAIREATASLICPCNFMK